MSYKTPSLINQDYSVCEIYEFNHNSYCYDDFPYFYDYVIEIIELINQDVRFLYATFEDEYTLYDRDNVDDMKYKYIDNAINKLNYAECDKFICEIGLQNAFNLYDNSGYDEISMRQLKNIKGIRSLLFGIIMFCITVKDEVEEE